MRKLNLTTAKKKNPEHIVYRGSPTPENIPNNLGFVAIQSAVYLNLSNLLVPKAILHVTCLKHQYLIF